MLRGPVRQDGYSMVELLAAVTIFALVFAAVSVGIGRALELNRTNRARSTSAYLASSQLEEVRTKAFDQVTLGRTTCVYSAPGPGCSVPAPYTVTQDVRWTAPGNTTSSCSVPTGGGGTTLAYKRVTVTVTWPDMGGVAPVSSQTLLTPPSGSFDPNEGHILVQLYDRNAAPLAGQTVSLTGPETATQPTTAEGCVFFAYLDPGTYTVTLSTSGYVGRQGDQPAVQTVDVQAGQVSNLSFDYDRAAILSMGLVAPSGSPAAAVPAGIALTAANSNLTVGTVSFQESVTGTGPRLVRPLFPYSSGYQVWAGDCADADPGSYPGGSRPGPLASNPGATTAGTAALDAVDVIVRRTSTTGPLVANAIVSGIHAAGTGCTAGETLTPTARTNASGRLRLALPYGSWRIRATTTSGTPIRTGLSTSFVLDPVSSTIPTLTVVVL